MVVQEKVAWLPAVRGCGSFMTRGDLYLVLSWLYFIEILW
jgi:hypothetical protein